MKLNEEVRIAAPRDVVRKMLLDPDVLARCIPGCEEMHKTSDDDFQAKVVLKIGPVKARFVGEVHVEIGEGPYEIILNGKGVGGVAGFANAVAMVNLINEGEDTLLSYNVEAVVGGRLAQLGSRLITSTANRLSNIFFENFNNHVSELVK